MATVRTWAINTAFLREMKDFNVEYWKTFNQLQQWILDRDAAGATLDPSKAQETPSLVRLVTQEMAKQFMLEETYGYLQTPDSRGAVYDSEVNRARMQHQSLYMTASEICESLERASFQGLLSDAIAAHDGAIGKLCRDWTEHEQLENKLIHGSNR